MPFKPGDRVVQVIHIGTRRVANGPHTVKVVGRGRVRLDQGSSLLFDANTGVEVGPAIPGCWSEIIEHE